MQSIQLRTEEYRISESTENLFSLKATPGKSSLHLQLEYNFASLYCPKTEKFICTVPSICQEKTVSTLFHTQVDAEFNLRNPSLKQKKNSTIQSFNSMKNIGEMDKNIMIPKPLSQYCQICVEKFDDYLEHLNHSSHKKKLRQCSVTNEDFQQMRSILQKKTAFAEKKITNNNSEAKQAKKRCGFSNCDELSLRKVKSQNPNKLIFSDSKKSEWATSHKLLQEVKSSLQMEQEEMQCFKKFGSKKRIIESSTGEHKTMTIPSEKNIELIDNGSRIKSVPKPISLEKIIVDQEDDVFGQELQFNFEHDLNLD